MAQTTTIMPEGRQRYYNNDGTPAAGGSVYTYAAGTTTPKTTYADADGTIPNPNPVPLDTHGEAVMFWTGSYKVNVKQSDGQQITGYPVDNLRTDPAGIWGVLAAAVGQALASLAADVGSSLVGFIQAGTGALRRTLQDKGRERVSPADYGAKLNGVDDDQPGIQRAINYIQNNFPSGTVEFPSGCKPKLNSGLTIDTNKCGINWNGAYVDWTGIPAGTIAFNVTQSADDVNRRPALNRAHPIRGGVHVGPGKTTNCIMTVLRDASASQVIAGVTFQDGGCWGWAKGAVLGQGSFFTNFDNWDWAAVVGVDMGTCIEILQESNSGEKNTFSNNRFGSADQYLVQGNGTADTHFFNTSFNFANRMTYCNAGSVYFTDCHVEGKSDTDWWMHLYGSNSAYFFSNTEFVIDGDKSLKELIYCDAGVTHGGVFLHQCKVSCSSQYSLELVGGRGRVQASHMANYAVGAQPTISWFLNLLAYGEFESLNYASEWVMGGTTPPAVATGYAHTGSNALRFAGIAGQNNSATATVPCKPGQLARAALWGSVTGYGTGGNFYATYAYLDKGGNVVGVSGAAMNITGNQAFTRFGFGNIPPAPPGTVSFRLTVSFFGVTTGTPFGYIDDVIINIT